MKKTEKRSIKNVERFNANPFLVGLDHAFELIVKKKPSQKIAVMDVNGVAMTNEDGSLLIAHASGGSKTFLKDNKQYTKLYSSTLEEIADLPVNAIRLLVNIIKLIKPHKDYVFFERDRMRDLCGWTANATYYEALLILIERQFVAAVKDSSVKFWINPDKIFNGDRRKLLPKK